MPISRRWWSGYWRIKVKYRPLLIAWIAQVSLAGLAAAEPAVPEGARRAVLIRMVRNDCGSCHGITLRGGIGLPLTPEALKDKPDSSLVATILHGRPGTPMPPWQPFLSEPEAEWIVENLKKGFPDVSPH